MFGLFDPPKGIPYGAGYRIDAALEGTAWRGIVYDRRGNEMLVDFPTPTKPAALERARQTVDGLVALQRRQSRG
jgi:hypothetical protein